MQTACSAKFDVGLTLKLTVLSGLEHFDHYWALSGKTYWHGAVMASLGHSFWQSVK